MPLQWSGGQGDHWSVGPKFISEQMLQRLEHSSEGWESIGPVLWPSFIGSQ